jgi:hypothetical protein
MSSCSPAGADEDAELGQKGGEQLAVAGAAAEQPGEPWRAEHRLLGSCAEPLRPSFAPPELDALSWLRAVMMCWSLLEINGARLPPALAP